MSRFQSQPPPLRPAIPPRPSTHSWQHIPCLQETHHQTVRGLQEVRSSQRRHHQRLGQTLQRYNTNKEENQSE